MKPHISELPTFAWQLVNGQRTHIEQSLAQLREQDIAPYLNTTKPLRVMDLANGRLRPQYALLRGGGHDIYGIDYVNRAPRSLTDLAYIVARRLYNLRLRGATPHTRADTLVCGDVGKLPFQNDLFDLATSVAAFEHFLDVPAVVAELHRVLRPGGIAWICIHVFTSLSGGHNVKLLEVPLQKFPANIDPWDHLRKRRLPFTVPLNEWRISQYVQAFERHFEIIAHQAALREGEEWLTSEIAAELAAYSRDELTSAAYVIVARKLA